MGSLYVPMVFLRLSVLELRPMYATDRRQTDRRQTKASLNAPRLFGLGRNDRDRDSAECVLALWRWIFICMEMFLLLAVTIDMTMYQNGMSSNVGWRNLK